MPATNAWDETTPAGSSLISAGDDAVRQFKLDTRERMAVEHVWNVGIASDGFHKQITQPAATMPANTSFLDGAGLSLTAANAQPGIKQRGTWNTTGAPSWLDIDVTDTASDAASLLQKWAVNGTVKFSVGKDGKLTFLGTLIAGSTGVQLTTAAGKIQAISSTYFDSLSGANLTGLNASQLTSGTVPLARLVDITNTEIAAAAAIAWSKVNKAGSSLADLATRSAADLSSGTLPLARLSGITNTEIAAGAAIAWSKLDKTGSSLADLATRSAADLSSGTLPDARFPATLPAASGANLTALPAANLAGTIAAAVQDNITRLGTISSGTVPWANVAKAGSSLADLATKSAAALDSGTLAQARLGTLTGAWSAALAVDTVIQAATDLIVVVVPDASTSISFKTDAANPPTVERGFANGSNGTSICCPVKKNDFFKAALAGGSTAAIYSIPIGN